MDEKKIERMKELSRIAKERTLSFEEQTERDGLRQEYLAAIRRNLEAQLDHTYILEADGTKRKLRRKNS